MFDRRTRKVALAVACLHLIRAADPAAATPAQGAGDVRQRLQPESAFATARILPNVSINGETPTSISPDGRRVVVRTVQGDLENDGIVIHLLVADRAPDGSIGAFRNVADFRSRALETTESAWGPQLDGEGYHRPIHWIDNDRIAFLISNPSGIVQITQVDLRSGDARFLTHHATQVVRFAIRPDGAILYTAQPIHSDARSRRLMETGFTVGRSADPIAIGRGFVDGSNFYDLFWNTSWYYQPPAAPPVSLRIGGLSEDIASFSTLSFSPDGRHALVSAGGFQVPAGWAAYRGQFQGSIADAIRQQGTHGSRATTKYYVLDLITGNSRELWDAPRGIDTVSWSPDGTKLLVVNTYLPLEAESEAARAGNSAAVVDIDSGRYTTLPLTTSILQTYEARWISSQAIQITSRHRVTANVEVVGFRRSGANWVSVPGEATSSETRYSIESRETADNPPALYEIDATSGTRRLALDPNPGFADRVRLADTRTLTGRLDTGETWSARLYLPMGFDTHHRYPLVIQSEYGAVPTEAFSLYGFGGNGIGVGPSLIGPGVAQFLANESILVAEVHVSRGDAPPAPEREGLRNSLAWEAVVSRLDQDGMIDPTRVGVTGFSRNGYYVEYALTHSRLPYAAPITADNWSPNYFTSTVLGWPQEDGLANGGPAFGEGLQSWLRNAPGFNVDRIRSPLMIQASQNTAGIMFSWEMFSRLNAIDHPVELWAPPRWNQGAHNSLNPSILLAVQHRVIDWYRFWLLGERDPSPEKAEQYRGWMILCAQQRAAQPTIPTHCPSS